MVIFCLVMLGTMLTIIAVEDWKSHTVSGVKCLLCWGLIFFAQILLDGSIIISVILIAAFVLFYALPEIPAIGSADFLPMIMYLCVFFVEGFTSPIIFIYPLCLLALLIPYGKAYGKMHGYVWKFGSNVYMPALPCFAAAWWLSTITYIVYTVIRG